MEGYCIRCKGRKEMPPDAREVMMANGRRAMQGKCPDCGVVMSRIMKDLPKEPAPAAAPGG